MGSFRSKLLGFALAGVPISAPAQGDVVLLSDRGPEERPTLLILGTAHFANPGRDEFNFEVEDVLSDARQAEIEALVGQLAAFQPTQVAVEMLAANQDRLDARYRAYREGSYQLSRNEVDQIGLRLAAEVGLERVNAVDWNDNPPGELSEFDWPSYAEIAGQEARLSAIRDPERFSAVPQLGQQTISTWLRQMNGSDALAESHRIYFDIAMIGDDTSQPGANWVGHWYSRNLRIFNNLVEIAERPQDRVLVIYGQGHAYLLRQFALESGAFRLIDVAEVLDE